MLNRENETVNEVNKPSRLREVRVERVMSMSVWDRKDLRISIAQSHNLASAELLERKIYSEAPFFDEEIVKCGKKHLKILLKRFDEEIK